jgi:hypothetical protein
VNLGPSIRAALLESPVAAGLATYQGVPAVFTRRPVPEDAAYPLAIVGPEVSVTDQDLLNERVPVVVRDVVVYGQKGAPGEDQYRVVEELAWAVRELFHRQKRSLTVADHHVVDVVTAGPIAAPTEDENLVGRLVSLTVRLQRRA